MEGLIVCALESGLNPGHDVGSRMRHFTSIVPLSSKVCENTPARLRGRHFCDKMALISQHSGQNGIIFCVYFYFRNMQIIFVSKVTGVVGLAFRILSRSAEEQATATEEFIAGG